MVTPTSARVLQARRARAEREAPPQSTLPVNNSQLSAARMLAKARRRRNQHRGEGGGSVSKHSIDSSVMDSYYESSFVDEDDDEYDDDAYDDEDYFSPSEGSYSSVSEARMSTPSTPPAPQAQSRRMSLSGMIFGSPDKRKNSIGGRSIPETEQVALNDTFPQTSQSRDSSNIDSFINESDFDEVDFNRTASESRLSGGKKSSSSDEVTAPIVSESSSSAMPSLPSDASFQEQGQEAMWMERDTGTPRSTSVAPQSALGDDGVLCVTRKRSSNRDLKKMAAAIKARAQIKAVPRPTPPPAPSQPEKPKRGSFAFWNRNRKKQMNQKKGVEGKKPPSPSRLPNPLPGSKVHSKPNYVVSVHDTADDDDSQTTTSLLEANVAQEAVDKMNKARQLLSKALELQASRDGSGATPRLEDSERLAKNAFAHAAAARRLVHQSNTMNTEGGNPALKTHQEAKREDAESYQELETALSYLTEQGETAAREHQRILFSQSFPDSVKAEDTDKKEMDWKMPKTQNIAGYANKARQYLESILPKIIIDPKTSAATAVTNDRMAFDPLSPIISPVRASLSPVEEDRVSSMPRSPLRLSLAVSTATSASANMHTSSEDSEESENTADESAYDISTLGFNNTFDNPAVPSQSNLPGDAARMPNHNKSASEPKLKDPPEQTKVPSEPTSSDFPSDNLSMSSLNEILDAPTGKQGDDDDEDEDRFIVNNREFGGDNSSGIKSPRQALPIIDVPLPKKSKKKKKKKKPTTPIKSPASTHSSTPTTRRSFFSSKKEEGKSKKVSVFKRIRSKSKERIMGSGSKNIGKYSPTIIEGATNADEDEYDGDEPTSKIQVAAEKMESHLRGQTESETLGGHSLPSKNLTHTQSHLGSAGRSVVDTDSQTPFSPRYNGGYTARNAPSMFRFEQFSHEDLSSAAGGPIFVRAPRGDPELLTQRSWDSIMGRNEPSTAPPRRASLYAGASTTATSVRSNDTYDLQSTTKKKRKKWSFFGRKKKSTTTLSTVMEKPTRLLRSSSANDISMMRQSSNTTGRRLSFGGPLQADYSYVPRPAPLPEPFPSTDDDSSGGGLNELEKYTVLDEPPKVNKNAADVLLSDVEINPDIQALPTQSLCSDLEKESADRYRAFDVASHDDTASFSLKDKFSFISEVKKMPYQQDLASPVRSARSADESQFFEPPELEFAQVAIGEDDCTGVTTVINRETKLVSCVTTPKASDSPLEIVSSPTDNAIPTVQPSGTFFSMIEKKKQERNESRSEEEVRAKEEAEARIEVELEDRMPSDETSKLGVEVSDVVNHKSRRLPRLFKGKSGLKGMISSRSRSHKSKITERPTAGPTPSPVPDLDSTTTISVENNPVPPAPVQVETEPVVKEAEEAVLDGNIMAVEANLNSEKAPDALSPVSEMTQLTDLTDEPLIRRLKQLKKGQENSPAIPSGPFRSNILSNGRPEPPGCDETTASSFGRDAPGLSMSMSMVSSIKSDPPGSDRVQRDRPASTPRNPSRGGDVSNERLQKRQMERRYQKSITDRLYG